MITLPVCLHGIGRENCLITIIIIIIISIIIITIIMLSPVTDLSLPVLILNQRRSPPLRVQDSGCSTFRIMCDVTSVPDFGSDYIE